MKEACVYPLKGGMSWQQREKRHYKDNNLQPDVPRGKQLPHDKRHPDGAGESKTQALIIAKERKK